MAESAKGPSTIGDTVVFGFGPQGRAQAMNLSESGIPVSVCIRPESPRATSVREAGIDLTCDPRSAARHAANAALLIPDSEQPGFYREHLHENLPEGAALIFAHGFAVHYGRIAPRPDIDVILVAPLAHGDALREGFEKRSGVPCVLAVAKDATGRAWERASEYARAIAGDGPAIRSTFAEEVETDLFAEQAVLCGGMPELVRAAFDTLVEGGYNPDIAYFSCLRELKAIVNLLLADSIAGMRSRISDTARYGSATRGKRIIDDTVRSELRQVLEEIRSGEFASELIADEKRGFTKLARALEMDAYHEIERVHRKHSAKR
jgi:ketol-acid reductoisomerase